MFAADRSASDSPAATPPPHRGTSGDEALWRALADPSRRQILDLLRTGARTTGELAEQFPFSRFAVMKHLRVLEEARLIVPERRGRERYNHLDPLPLQTLYRRWIRPFAARAADRILRLEETLERAPDHTADRHETTHRPFSGPKGEAMSPEETTSKTPPSTTAASKTPASKTLTPETPQAESAHIAEVKIETTLEAPPKQVWQALTRDIGRWWPAEFYAGGTAGERTYRLEAHPGGRMLEEWGDDGGLLWATVVGVEKERSLRICGPSFPGWGGPGLLLGTWELEPRGSGKTLLRFSEAVMGRVTDDYLESKDKGWRFLFDGCLKAFVEGSEPPKWED